MLGETISHYRILEKLGQGGMGEVYLAEDTRLGHSVAIKKLPHHLATNRQLRVRFQREAKAVANLRHPYIVPLYEYDEIDGELFLITEYLPGGSLRDVINQRQASIPVENVLRWGIQAAEGLAEAHGRGLLHRDIKPDNLLLTENGDLRIADFGLVLFEGETRVTEAGSTLGTCAYMSPEQLRGEESGPSGDLFALGATLYELLAARPAFQGANQGALVRSVLEDEPASLREAQPGLPTQLTTLIEELLQKDSRRRPTSAEAVANRLRGIAQEQGFSATVPLPVVGASRANRRLAPWQIVLVVLLAVAVATLVQRFRGPGTPIEQDGFTRIAIMPFAIRGAQDYLHQGMVDLLSAQLDGAGSLRSVDKNVLLSKIGSSSKEQLDLSRAARLAENLGARLFVLGDVFGAGEEIVLNASLYDFEQGDAAVATASVEGPAKAILDLVDRLALQLVGDRIQDIGDASVGFTSLDTESYDALKFFLEGERRYREARFTTVGIREHDPEGERVIQAYRNAVEADSTFAVAWIQLSRAVGTLQGHLGMREARSARRAALRHRDRLSKHDRMLLDARSYVQNVTDGCCGEPNFDFDELERNYLDILREWPDDAEAHFGLGLLRFELNSRRGRSPNEAKSALDRARELDPSNWLAIRVRAGVALKERDYATYARLLTEYYGDSKPASSERAPAVFSLGGAAEQEALLQELESDYHQAVWASMYLAGDVEHLETAQRIARTVTVEKDRKDVRAVGHVLLGNLALARGRWSEARVEFDTAAQLEDSYGREHRALTAAIPVFGVAEEDLQQIRADLQAWDPSTLEIPEDPQPWAQTPEDRDLRLRVHDHLHPVLRSYLLGLLDLRLGNLARANQAAEDLLAMTELPFVPLFSSSADSLLVKDFAYGLRARVAEAEGDLEGAWEQYRGQLFPTRPGSAFIPNSPFYFESLERYMRAEFLFEMERYEEALGWYGGLIWDRGFEFIYRAPANLRSGQIHEKLGDPEKAREHYSLFVEAWKDCDTHLRPLVDEARARMAALQS